MQTTHSTNETRPATAPAPETKAAPAAHASTARARSLALAIALASAFGTTAGAATQGPDGEPRPPRVPPLFGLIDGDRDGLLSIAELATAATLLRGLDVNGDGQLGPREYAPPRPQPPPPDDAAANTTGSNRHGPARAGSTTATAGTPPLPPSGPGGSRGRIGRPPPPPVFITPLVDAIDLDDDGILSASEVSSATLSLQALDADGDLQLSLEEILPPPPPRDEDDSPAARG